MSLNQTLPVGEGLATEQAFALSPESMLLTQFELVFASLSLWQMI
jgi:hypothetical protein